MLKPKEVKRTKTMMLFGTFDIIHEGHLDLFTQARALAKNSTLIISVARDTNVKKIKGEEPRNSEKVRQNNLKKMQVADKVILGSLTNYFRKIELIEPDIIALGYDQVAYVDRLKEDLKRAKLKTKVLRLKAYKPQIFKTSILNPR